MTDPMGTYDVSQIDKLVKDNINGDDKVEIPEEITTQMADEIEPEVDLERDLDVLQRMKCSLRRLASNRPTDLTAARLRRWARRLGS